MVQIIKVHFVQLSVVECLQLSRYEIKFFTSLWTIFISSWASLPPTLSSFLIKYGNLSSMLFCCAVNRCMRHKIIFIVKMQRLSIWESTFLHLLLEYNSCNVFKHSREQIPICLVLNDHWKGVYRRNKQFREYWLP